MIIVSLVNLFVVVTVVVVHYEFLSRLSVRRVKPRFNHRVGIVFGVCGALAAHTVEVWIFAFAYYFMNRAPGWGELFGQFSGGLMDCVYFSFTTFTTLGFGDIHPVGPVRFLTGVEALTGLVLITWTASFLFLEMQRHWDSR
ncbi:ion transporter [Stutzerimonas stutzeri]|uniref:Ion transporter n=1 Tax=Stutzerimonas stutzeri TaxID=316 RepID=W8RRQ2_STUST|nr:potassium channel family protein [Stutzerimonas stutzeri]AHL74711.1 ion transporter [Stutzerimonas stutzeri]MCQ4329242.1 potassium channel family protein [Stutzerimonas stutzeri]